MGLPRNAIPQSRGLKTPHTVEPHKLLKYGSQSPLTATLIVRLGTTMLMLAAMRTGVTTAIVAVIATMVVQFLIGIIGIGIGGTVPS